jgi:hypothetical protein
VSGGALNGVMELVDAFPYPHPILEALCKDDDRLPLF